MIVAEQGFFPGVSGNMGRAHVDRAYAQAQGQRDMILFELAVAGTEVLRADATLKFPRQRVTA